VISLRDCGTTSSTRPYLGFLGGHEPVAVGVASDLFLEGLAGVEGEDLVERSLRRRISLAWMLMSLAWPCTPPQGWWIMMRALGRA
jgi:hypothetical protein